MRKISRWAKRHPIWARSLIVVSRCFLLFLAYFLGTALANSHADFSPLWFYPILLLFIASGMFYPAKKPAGYAKRKAFDFAVCLSGFLLMVCLVVQLHKPQQFYQSMGATVPVETPVYKNPEAGKLLEQFNSGEKTSFSRKEKRIIRKEFNYQLLRYATAKLTGNKSEENNAGLIILTCVAAVGFIFLIASLACSLSCNGHDGAAVLVAVGGTALVIFGAVMIIRGLKRKKQRAEALEQNSHGF